MKLTYSNLVEFKIKAKDSLVNWKKYDDDNVRLKPIEKYVDFFNDFRDEALDKYTQLLTMDDFIVAYDCLWELSMLGRLGK